MEKLTSRLVTGIGWLPLSWIDSSLGTDKAVKADKAIFFVHLWDQRSCLPLGIQNKAGLKWDLSGNAYARFSSQQNIGGGGVNMIFTAPTCKLTATRRPIERERDDNVRV